MISACFHICLDVRLMCLKKKLKKIGNLERVNGCIHLTKYKKQATKVKVGDTAHIGPSAHEWTHYQRYKFRSLPPGICNSSSEGEAFTFGDLQQQFELHSQVSLESARSGFEPKTLYSKGTAINHCATLPYNHTKGDKKGKKGWKGKTLITS